MTKTTPPATLIATVLSSSKPDLFYAIKRHSDGEISCSCKGWQYYGRCKHSKPYLPTTEDKGQK